MTSPGTDLGPLDRPHVPQPAGGNLLWSRFRRIIRRSGGRRQSAAYLVFNEHLWHPLLRGQVLELLKRLRPRLDVRAFYLVAFVPSRDLTAHRQELEDIAAELERFGITLELRPLPPLPLPRPPFTRVWGIWTPHESRRVMPLAACLVGLAVISLRIRRGVTVVHARSYPAAAAAAPAARLVGAKLLFDTRSPYPEENVVAGRWSPGSLDVRFWQWIERSLLRRAAVSVAIAPAHERHLRMIEPTARTVVIPNNVDVERFAAAMTERERTRRSLGVGPDEILMCYLGSLNRTWNSPEVYAGFYRMLEGWGRRHRLLLVVPEGDHAIVRSALETTNLREGTDYFLVHAEPNEPPRWLAGADLGLQLFASPDVRIGVKVVEYLAAGLPVLTNRNVQGAAALVEEEGVGLLVDLDNNEMLVGQLEDLLAKRVELRERCLALARTRFSTDRVADQYAAIYGELLAHR